MGLFGVKIMSHIWRARVIFLYFFSLLIIVIFVICIIEIIRAYQVNNSSFDYLFIFIKIFASL